MKLKLSFRGGLLPFGKDKKIKLLNNVYAQPIITSFREYWIEFKFILIVLTIALIILLTNVITTLAQANVKPALMIGDRLPDIALNDMINRPGSKHGTADYRGKMLIIDFWATWCAPCVAMIPKLDSLQAQYAANINFLSVAYQSSAEIKTFVDRWQVNEKRRFMLPTVVADTTMVKLFPHKTLPHFVWIDADGIVAAITGEEEITDENLKKFINGKALTVRQKDDTRIPYDRFQPLLINGNGNGGQTVLYHSVLTPYTHGLRFGYQYFKPDSIKGMKISCWNVGPEQLFKVAYSEGKINFNPNRIALEVKDTSRLTTNLIGYKYEEWLGHGNGFCYELIVPPALAGDAWKIMQEDLTRFFPQYHVSVQQRNTKCYALIRTSKEDHLKTAGGEHDYKLDFFGCSLRNAPLSEFIGPLDSYYMQNSPVPILDETGYTGMVDLEIEAKLSSVPELNQALAKYGLKFILTERMMDILVFQDSPANGSRPAHQ